MDITDLEVKCKEFIHFGSGSDAAHDIAHIERVVVNAKAILQTERADDLVVVAAAWLHDCVILPKNHPDRRKASTLAAEKASDFLRDIQFPSNKIAATANAVETHSFSAGLRAETPEAKIVQDADRLDALGAIGIARCFAVGGQLGRPIYHPGDPLAENRAPDDSVWTVDHFYKKLFILPKTMHTLYAKKEAERRVRYMKEYLRQLANEIGK